MIKISIIAICFSLLFVLLAWFMLPKFLEQPKYKVVRKENDIEIRSYDKILMSSVKVYGNQYNSLRNGFQPLVRYIGAKERVSEKISMTAPVIQTISDESENWTVSFAMPSKYNIDNLPKPTDDDIFFEEIQPSLAAVIRFSGVADTSLLNQKAKILKRWLEENSYTESSSPKFLFYNDPSTPGFLRRNEVMIIINK
ncbi:MAG: SOUL family heme-binding protein [Paracoccaceae bacterium]|tara:strand:+ start:592 stop:1182 length:591 start_codon:yes stop_codon:yes gene_type:complete